MMSSKDSCELYRLPSGEEVAFFPEGHTYVCEGRVLPSITTLIQVVYGNQYNSVSPEVLQRYAKYGTVVHKEIQDLIELRDAVLGQIDPGLARYQETKNYFTFIEPIYKIDPIMLEKPVLLHDRDGYPVSAGRFDMFCLADQKPTLVDFKTTSTVHRQYVVAQLNLYLLAAKQSGYFVEYEGVNLGVIHLSGETSKYIPIPVLAEEFSQRFIEAAKTISIS